MALAAGLAWACVHGSQRGIDPSPASLHASATVTPDDPTVRGARLFPEKVDLAHGWGIEPDGGTRSIVAGIRVVAKADGSMSVADGRLPATPSSVIGLPPRLGGGFLFAIGPHVWRSDEWLGAARAFFSWSTPISQMLVGLDRVYLRSPQGALVALDPVSGAQIGLGPLPASPSIGRLEALDAWRAIAIADLRGVLMTVDAGSSWRPVLLPIDPSDVVALEDSIAVGGVDEGHQMQWWEVRSDGQSARLSFPPRSTEPTHPVSSLDRISSQPAGRGDGAPPVARPFGPRPLAAALEDGWPLADGTALVARDGALGRIRLSDGAMLEMAPDAFPFKPARCHALALGFDRALRHQSNAAASDGGAEGEGRNARGLGADAGAIGFVCGEPRGRTVVYRWDPSVARLVELRRFETPREVLGFGNGALAVRGACAADAPEGTPVARGVDLGPQEWCVAPPGGGWREWSGPSEARVVVLADGRVVQVRPPSGGDLGTARLVLGEEPAPSEIPLAFPALPIPVAAAMASGIWTDGFEERRPGVIGGWIDAAGSMIGIEIRVSGEARVGEYIRDAGAPVASGRWAFGWTASRRGFESTDGGMTWKKEIPMPDVMASGRGVHERACGPVGCIGAGWLRVGWGESDRAMAPDALPAAPSPEHIAPSLDFECTAYGGRPPAQPVPSVAARTTRQSRGRGPLERGPQANLYSGSTWGAVSEMPPFEAWAGPGMPADNLGLTLEMQGAIEPRLRVPLARLYVWGPESGEWDQLGRWQVRWQWPWGGWPDVRASSVATSPWGHMDSARRDLGMGPGIPTAWTVVDTDDPDHALFLVRRSLGAPSLEVLALESDRAPVEVRRSSGEPFADIEGTARVGGHWYFVTTQGVGETAASVLWSIEGAAAREILRVPRAGFETRPALRLARNADGRTLGLVVDGQLAGLRGGAPRWVAGVDVEAGTVSTPEPLAPVDLSDRAISTCTGDDPGWELDVPYPGAVRLRIGAQWEATLMAPLARMRISRLRACVERLLGTTDGYGSSAPDALTDPAYGSAPRDRETTRAVPVSVFSAKMRHGLRCWSR